MIGAATRDLWPLWRRLALEPILKHIEFTGNYELNLVAFASVDGQCDGVLRSGRWTRSVDVFRGYCESLTFEGSGGNGLGEALNEASYLAKCPGELTHGVQHVMLCATESMGRLPVTWAFRNGRDSRLHALTILSHMISTLGVTVSIVTEPMHGVLLKKFGTLVGARRLKKCEKLSEGRRCLMLIHPGWRHGYEALFPELTEMDEWTETTQTQTFISDSAHSSGTLEALDDVTGHIIERESHTPMNVYISFSNPRSFPDAVKLDSWHKSNHVMKHCWKEDDMQEDCSCDVEFGLECGLLGLEEPTETERDVMSEKESKLESSASYGVHSPALSSTKPSRDQDLSQEVSQKMGPFARAAVQLAMPEDSSSCLTHRNTFEHQGSKTLSSTASVSEEREATGRKMEHKRTLERSSAVAEVHPETRQSRTLDNHLTWRIPTQGTPNVSNGYPKIDNQMPYPGTEHDLHEAKRLRTSYGRANSTSLIKPPSVYSPQDREGTTSSVNGIKRNARASEVSHHQARLPPRALVPSSGFGWNVEWSGPLYLAGPLVRQSEPQKLFDLEILCKRTPSNLPMWPKELVVHSMARREQQRCLGSCMINIKFESLTDMGKAFGKWLTENNMIAIVDLLGEKASRLIIFVQDSNNSGQCQLVGGFQRDWTQRI